MNCTVCLSINCNYGVQVISRGGSRYHLCVIYLLEVLSSCKKLSRQTYLQKNGVHDCELLCIKTLKVVFWKYCSFWSILCFFVCGRFPVHGVQSRLGKSSKNKKQLLWQSQSKKNEFEIFQILRDKILTNMVYSQAMVFIQTSEKSSWILLSLTLRDALPRALRHGPPCIYPFKMKCYPK